MTDWQAKKERAESLQKIREEGVWLRLIDEPYYSDDIVVECSIDNPKFLDAWDRVVRAWQNRKQNRLGKRVPLNISMGGQLEALRDHCVLRMATAPHGADLAEFEPRPEDVAPADVLAGYYSVRSFVDAVSNAVEERKGEYDADMKALEKNSGGGAASTSSGATDSTTSAPASGS